MRAVSSSCGSARHTDSGTTGPSVPDLGPFGSVDQLIRQQYVDAARRPTGPEVVAARAALDEHGESAGDFMAAVVSGPGREAQAQELARLYLGELGRLPAFAPFTYWRAQRAAGQPVTSVAQIFASSGEFAARFPTSLSKTAFVTQLYEKILLRPPDPAGLSGWVHQLVTGTPRWLVALRVVDSPEYRADTAASADSVLAFAVMLSRIPTTAELSSETLRAVDATSGAVRWSQTADGALLSAPVVANGTVYVAGSNGVVHGFDEATGATVWTGVAGSSFVLEDWNASVRTGMAIAATSSSFPPGTTSRRSASGRLRAHLARDSPGPALVAQVDRATAS